MKNTTPAVLVYFQDLLSGTDYMTDEEFGQYMRLLMRQNVVGHMSDEYLKRTHMDHIFPLVEEKFNRDEDGKIYNVRMENEIQRRVNYSESRSKNSTKKDKAKKCVYMFVDKKTGLTKIGSSNDPVRRMNDISNELHHVLELYGYCVDAPYGLEDKLHKEYEHKRHHHEWFDLTEEEREKIKRENHMIFTESTERDFHTETETETVINTNKKGLESAERKGKKRFAPPTVEEVKAYCVERCNSVNAERFVDYYTSNGWKVGKNSMKDWKAAVRTWEKRDKERNPVKQDKPRNEVLEMLERGMFDE